MPVQGPFGRPGTPRGPHPHRRYMPMHTFHLREASAAPPPGRTWPEGYRRRRHGGRAVLIGGLLAALCVGASGPARADLPRTAIVITISVIPPPDQAQDRRLKEWYQNVF